MFFFYAEEGTEPAHVHVDKGGGSAKLRLQPLPLARVDGLKVNEIRQILRIAERNQSKTIGAME